MQRYYKKSIWAKKLEVKINIHTKSSTTSKPLSKILLLGLTGGGIKNGGGFERYKVENGAVSRTANY